MLIADLYLYRIMIVLGRLNLWWPNYTDHPVCVGGMDRGRDGVV